MYLKKLRESLEAEISKKKPRTLDQIFKLSKGASPDIVFPLLAGNPILKDINPTYYGLRKVNNVIPESNPTNFDWRFSDQTVKKIVSIIRNRKYKSIALFGTPSLFLPISKMVKKVILYDINVLLKIHFKDDS